MDGKNIKILSKETNIQENRAVIRRETEEHLSRQDILYSIYTLESKKQQFKDQIRALKRQHDAIDPQLVELKELLSLVPEEEIESV